MELEFLQDLDIKPKLPCIAKGIVKTLLYFDIFDYPLTEDELYQFSDCKDLPYDEFHRELNILADMGLISKKDKFIFMGTDLSKIASREKGNSLAAKYMKKAQKFSKIISFFPYVRGVYISGSLSKGHVHEKGDIDYFIITEPGRLWVARCMLVLFKKIFLLNSRKFFCLNYYIDSQSLEIPDQNIYTANEIVTLIPTYNYKLYLDLRTQNSWINEHYPHATIKTPENVIPEGKIWISRVFEKLLSNDFGDRLDNYCFKLTLRFWKRKFNHFDESEFDHALRSKKNISKHHPNRFQSRVLSAFNNKIKEFEKRNNLGIA